jgi:hypothetical protein
VLLEYACQTDYKLITQEIEEGHLNRNTDLQDRIEELTRDFLLKDAELQEKIKKIKYEYNEMEK